MAKSQKSQGGKTTHPDPSRVLGRDRDDLKYGEQNFIPQGLLALFYNFR